MPTAPTTTLDRRHILTFLPLILGIACLALLAWANAFPPDMVQVITFIPARVQLALLYVGSALVAWGAAGSPRLWGWRQEAAATTARRGIQRWGLELLVVLLITLGGLAIRLVGLETTLRLLLDETNYLVGASTAISSPNFPILFPMSDTTPFPWLFSFLQADMVTVFGRSLTGLRAASSLVGAATVPVVYWLVRMLYDRRTAVVAAIVLATFPPHLHFSRIVASLTIADALMGTIVFACLIRALKTRQPLDWGITGAALGISHYFSESSKLVFTPLVLVFLGWLALTNPESRDTIRRNVGRMLIASVIIAVPYYTTQLAHHKPMMGRMQDNSISIAYWLSLPQDGLTDQEIYDTIEHVTRPFRFILSEPETEHIYYAGTEPLVMRILAPFLLVGCLAALARWRKPGILPLAWVLTIALGNGLFIRNSASSPRFVVAMPPLAILMALGITSLYGLLARRRVSRRWRRALLAGLLAAVAAVQLIYYFGPHLDHLRYHHRRLLTYSDIWDATLRVYETMPYNTQGIYVGRPPSDGSESSLLLGFLQNGNLYPFLGYNPEDFTIRSLRGLVRDRGYAFLIEGRQGDAIGLIYRFFPNALPPKFSTWDIAPDEEYLLIYVPPPGIP